MKRAPIPPASTVSVRFATRADVPTILDFIRQLATFEREPDAVKTTEADLLRDGFGARSQSRPRRCSGNTTATSSGVGWACPMPASASWKRPALSERSIRTTRKVVPFSYL